MALVTLKTFDNHIDAHLLKTKLESEGIACFIFDENIVTLNPLYNVGVHGIKLKIMESDAGRAMEILALLEDRPYTDEQNREITCPRCGSEKLYGGFTSNRNLTGILSSIVSFLLMIFPFYTRKVYKCRACGHEFRPGHRATADA